MNLTATTTGKYKLIAEGLVTSLRLENIDTGKRLISLTVIASGLQDARVTCGSGEIPATAISILDDFMVSQGFSEYKWEREVESGKFETVTRKIKAAK